MCAERGGRRSLKQPPGHTCVSQADPVVSGVPGALTMNAGYTATWDALSGTCGERWEDPLQQLCLLPCWDERVPCPFFLQHLYIGASLDYWSLSGLTLGSVTALKSNRMWYLFGLCWHAEVSDGRIVMLNTLDEPSEPGFFLLALLVSLFPFQYLCRPLFKGLCSIFVLKMFLKISIF